MELQFKGNRRRNDDQREIDENRARFFSRKLDTDVPPPEIDKKGETELMIETCGIFLILLFLLNPITWSLLGKDTERALDRGGFGNQELHYYLTNHTTGEKVEVCRGKAVADYLKGIHCANFTRDTKIPLCLRSKRPFRPPLRVIVSDQLLYPGGIANQTTFVESTHRHESVRLNIALICSEWEELRRRELGLDSAEGETTVEAPKKAKEDDVLPAPNPDFDYDVFPTPNPDFEYSLPFPTPNPDFDYSLPFLVDDPEEDPESSIPFHSANPDFDYSPQGILLTEEPEDNPDKSNPFPTPNPDFDYSLPSNFLDFPDEGR